MAIRGIILMNLGSPGSTDVKDVEYTKEIYNLKKYPVRLRFIKPFYNDPGYLNALAENMKPYLDKEYDHLLFSYHGVPERHIRKGDITRSHCLQVNNCCSVDSP